MPKNKFLLNTVFSSTFFFIGVYFLYSAQTGPERNINQIVFWDVGCAFSAFAIALRPDKLLEKVNFTKTGIELPKADGWAALLNLLSVGMLVFSALAFGIHLFER